MAMDKLDDPDQPIRNLVPYLITAGRIILVLFAIAHFTYGGGGLVLRAPGAAAWAAGGVLFTAWIPGLLAWRFEQSWARWAAVSYFCLMIMLFIL